MSVTPKSAKGTVLKIGDGEVSEVFTAIPGVQDIDGPDLAGTDEFEATHHGSSAKEYVLGLPDGGELSFPLVYDSSDAQQQALEAVGDTDTNFQMVFPDAGAKDLAFAAKLKQFKFNAPVQGVLIVNVTLKISGTISEVS